MSVHSLCLLYNSVCLSQGGADSDAGEALSERAAGVHLAARPQRKTRAGAATQTGATQGMTSHR